jgi:hypothetical protein
VIETEQSPGWQAAGGLIDEVWPPEPDASPGEPEPDAPRREGTGGHTSWLPVDLGPILSGGHTQPAPSILYRSDGNALIYAGKLHSFAGESESLKSWAAIIACSEEINAGRHCLYIDFEDCAESVAGRFLALGNTAAQLLEFLHYVRPTEPFGPAGWADMTSTPQPSIAVLDGITEAMELHGLKLLDNTDIASFYRRIPRMLTAKGVAVVMIDHVTKSSEGRGRYSIGGQHKLAAIDGAAYMVEPIKPFGRGQHGISRIMVAKDRPGRVREYLGGSNHVADLHLRSQVDGSVLPEIKAPRMVTADPESKSFRPTAVMEKVSRLLEEKAEAEGFKGYSKNVIEQSVGGKAQVVRAALELLVAEEFVCAEKVGPALLHRSEKPFRAEGGS